MDWLRRPERGEGRNHLTVTVTVWEGELLLKIDLFTF
jgi:hypothetical protein